MPTRDPEFRRILSLEAKSDLLLIFQLLLTGRDAAMRRVILRVAACFLLTSVVLCSAQDGGYAEIRPVDEASQQADFFTFRAHLQAAIARHDTAAVLSIVSVKIRNNFGGDDGREAFERVWRITSPDTRLWEKLGKCTRPRRHVRRERHVRRSVYIQPLAREGRCIRARGDHRLERKSTCRASAG